MMSVRTTLEVEMQSSLMCNRHSHARAQNDVPAKDDLRAKLDANKCRLRVRQRKSVEHPKQNGRRTAGWTSEANEHGPVDNCDAQLSATAPCEEDGRDLQFADVQMLVIIFVRLPGLDAPRQMLRR
jgi:hypothetical protein